MPRTLTSALNEPRSEVVMPPTRRKCWMDGTCGTSSMSNMPWWIGSEMGMSTMGNSPGGRTLPISAAHCSHAYGPQKSSTHRKPPFRR